MALVYCAGVYEQSQHQKTIEITLYCDCFGSVQFGSKSLDPNNKSSTQSVADRPIRWALYLSYSSIYINEMRGFK